MVGKTLLVMRHAKSSWKTNDPDFRRPLSARGTRDAVVAGQALADFEIDIVLCSTAARAQQTWQCAMMGGASAKSVRMRDSLYQAWTAQVLVEIREVPAGARTVLVIGHEPAASDLVTRLAVSSAITARVEEKFPTAAIAVLRHDRAWDELDDGTAQLLAFEVPRG